MERQMKEQKEDIRQKLYSLRLDGRERYLKFMGIDVEKVRELEKNIDAQYMELAAAVKETLKDSGKEIVEQHNLSIERTSRIHERNLERIIELPRLYPELVPRLPRLFCYCFPLSLAQYIDKGHSVTIDPPSGGTGAGSVTYDPTDCVAHPHADASGGGTGTINSVEVKTWCKFAFTPTHDGFHCIDPTALMNGHMLLWTWGTCGGTPEDLGSGSVKVELKVRVDQLSATLKTIQHKIVDEVKTAGGDIHTGFYYDSAVHGGAYMTVYLEGGHEAVVFVECVCEVEVANHGKVWVDMQTSPHFYYKVPEVRWGRVFCYPWALPLKTVTT